MVESNGAAHPRPHWGCIVTDLAEQFRYPPPPDFGSQPCDQCGAVTSPDDLVAWGEMDVCQQCDDEACAVCVPAGEAHAHG